MSVGGVSSFMLRSILCCLHLFSGETPALYTVLPEKTASVSGAMMGSSHVYDMASAVPGAIKKVTFYYSGFLDGIFIFFIDIVARHLVRRMKALKLPLIPVSWTLTLPPCQLGKNSLCCGLLVYINCALQQCCCDFRRLMLFFIATDIYHLYFIPSCQI